MRLSTRLHDRDAAGFVHVYPVLSRRSRGVSLGINLNPNNACNWRCAYCQVPGLIRGAAPEIDLGLLEREARLLLEAIVHGTYMEEHVPEGSRRLNDIALSGNGEATTSRQFPQVIDLVKRLMGEFRLIPDTRLILITNGSLAHRPEVQQGLDSMALVDGEIWFKLDSATVEGRRQINDTEISNEKVRANLKLCADRCRTRIQTLVLARDGQPPSETEVTAYLDFLAGATNDGLAIQDVLLYGLERDSHQPEAGTLSKLPVEWLRQLAARIEALGLPAQVHP